MKLNYKQLKKKYLKFFDNVDKCDYALTDVLFAFQEIYYFIKKPEVENILEIGSGTGILLRELSIIFPEKKFTGLDPYKSGFHGYETISGNIRLNKNLKINQIAIDKFQPNIKYDLIFSFNVFEHLKKQEKYLKLTYKFLNTNGKNLIMCPNYDFPYEPHFLVPIIFNKQVTFKIFKKKILNYERKTKEFGLWKHLNFNGKNKINKMMEKNKINYIYDQSIKNRILDRLKNDNSNYFKKRQGIFAKLAILARFFLIDKIFFDFLKIPFPYMKLIIIKKS